jgi:hypothetical protein
MNALWERDIEVGLAADIGFIPKEIVETILEDPPLQEFFHPGVPGRVPLIFSDKFLDPALSLNKFGKPIKILPDAAVSQGGYLRFTEFTMDRKKAIVQFEYRIEGIVATYTLHRSRKQKWVVMERKISER